MNLKDIQVLFFAAMKFFGLCLSPAIDATVTLPHDFIGNGDIVKGIVDVENVGGKAINVMRWLSVRGNQTACAGLLGEDNAFFFERVLDKYSIEDFFVRVSGATRRNETVMWSNGSVKLNRMAFPDLQNPEALLSPSLVPENSIAVLSGSLPAHCSTSIYATWIRDLKRRGIAVVLDACKEELRQGLKANPDIIKPNIDECADAVGFVPQTDDDFTKATRILHNYASHVIISAGDKGAWFDGVFVKAPYVDVTDTTAAGDTLLAEYCHRTFTEQDPNAAKWAVAAGSAACLMPGGDPPDIKTVEALYAAIS